MFYRKLIFAAGLALVFAALQTGCQTGGPAPRATGPAATNTTAKTNLSPVQTTVQLPPEVWATDLLQEGEYITISFTGVDDPPPRHEERLKEDGTITLPYIGEIKAVGKTRGQLEKEIHDKYVNRFYQRLTVTVTAENRFYFVRGEVRSPNQYKYTGPTTVTKAIATAGDFTNFAKKTKVELIRYNGQKFTVDCKKARRKTALDLPIYPGDQIIVPRRLW